VFASEALASRAIECPVQRDVGTSDHAPVIVSFRNGEPAQPEPPPPDDEDEPFVLT